MPTSNPNDDDTEEKKSYVIMTVTKISPKNHFKRITQKAKGTTLTADNTSWTNSYNHCERYQLMSLKAFSTKRLNISNHEQLEALTHKINKLKMNNYSSLLQATKPEEDTDFLIYQHPTFKRLMKNNQNIKNIRMSYYHSFYTMNSMFTS